MGIESSTEWEDLIALLKRRQFNPIECGLNADWCVRAAYIPCLTPGVGTNLGQGGVYVLEDEDDPDGGFEIARRWEPEDDGYQGTGSNSDVRVTARCQIAGDVCGILATMVIAMQATNEASDEPLSVELMRRLEAFDRAADGLLDAWLSHGGDELTDGYPFDRDFQELAGDIGTWLFTAKEKFDGRRFIRVKDGCGDGRDGAGERSDAPGDDGPGDAPDPGPKVIKYVRYPSREVVFRGLWKGRMTKPMKTERAALQEILAVTS